MKINIIRDFVQSGNINFLIGSGLSRPYLPVLGNIEKQMAAIKDAPANQQPVLEAVLFKKYFEKVILPNREIYDKSKYDETLGNYCDFLNIWNSILHNRCGNLRSKQANIFSTNIDLFVEKAAEETGVEFNDGFIGSVAPVFSEANFQKSVLKNSIHFQNSTELPTFNLLKIHGSINWKTFEDKVRNDIELSSVLEVQQALSRIKGSSFPNYKKNNAKILAQIKRKPNAKEFLDAYNELLIVNPTKKKFSETVFDVHFYELMRLMSNSLEKENSVLFVMGFSFEDEHIRNIVERALKTNPTLVVFIFSYDNDSTSRYVELFGDNYSNLIILTPSEFSEANELKDGEEIQKFDFKSINRAFGLLLKIVPVHFGYGSK